MLLKSTDTHHNHFISQIKLLQ